MRSGLASRENFGHQVRPMTGNWTAPWCNRSVSDRYEAHESSIGCPSECRFCGDRDVYHAIVDSRCFRAYRWSSKLDVHVFGTGRF